MKRVVLLRRKKVGDIKRALAQILKEDFDIEMPPEDIHRIYAGHWQRSAGAASWSAYNIESGWQVVSFFTMTEIVKNRGNLELKYNHLYGQHELEIKTS